MLQPDQKKADRERTRTQTQQLLFICRSVRRAVYMAGRTAVSHKDTNGTHRGVVYYRVPASCVAHCMFVKFSRGEAMWPSATALRSELNPDPFKCRTLLSSCDQSLRPDYPYVTPLPLDRDATISQSAFRREGGFSGEGASKSPLDLGGRCMILCIRLLGQQRYRPRVGVGGG